jgi:holo-[acyl-carrier protein] synthase
VSGHIIGVGVDMTDQRRIARSLERFGEAFLNRCFTEAEREESQRRPAKLTQYCATRFAAKEAVSKALGTGFRMGVTPRQIETLARPSGAPYVQLYRHAEKRLRDLTPDGMEASMQISMSDESHWTLAFAVFSVFYPTHPQS